MPASVNVQRISAYRRIAASFTVLADIDQKELDKFKAKLARGTGGNGPPTPQAVLGEVLAVGTESNGDASLERLHPKGDGPLESVAERVFALWQGLVKPQGKSFLTPERTRVVNGRLAQGYPEEDLLDAVKGAHRDPWVLEHHSDLTHILRNGANLERYRDMERFRLSGRRVEKPAMIPGSEAPREFQPIDFTELNRQIEDRRKAGLLVDEVGTGSMFEEDND